MCFLEAVDDAAGLGRVSLYPVRVRVRVSSFFGLFCRATMKLASWSTQLAGWSAHGPHFFFTRREMLLAAAFLAGHRDWIVQATSGFFTRLETFSGPRRSSHNKSRTSWIRSNYGISRLSRKRHTHTYTPVLKQEPGADIVSLPAWQIDPAR